MPKAILIEDQGMYLYNGLTLKRDLLKRDGSGRVAFVEVGSGNLQMILPQEMLEEYKFPLDEELEDEDIDEQSDPSEGFAEFLPDAEG